MIPPHPPDVDLVVRIAAGDRGAFETFYGRFAPRIMAFVHHLLADRDAAEDATQETFVNVWRSASRFRPGAPVEPWLFRIARHEAYDAARRRRRLRAVGGATGADDRAEGEAGVPGREARADAAHADPTAAQRAADDALLAAALRIAIATLSAPLREAFVLVRVLGRAHDDAATLLDVPVGTVKSRLAAAEAALRRRLVTHAPSGGAPRPGRGAAGGTP